MILLLQHSKWPKWSYYSLITVLVNLKFFDIPSIQNAGHSRCNLYFTLHTNQMLSKCFFFKCQSGHHEKCDINDSHGASNNIPNRTLA